jgi:glycoside/pentoside/hexuronide:cation symporter, GPH family
MSVIAPANESPPEGEGRPVLQATMAPAEDNHSARSKKLGFGVLALYGSGAAFENITSYAIGGLLPFYLTIVCGLSGTLAAVVTGLTLLVDAFFDPAAGSLSDNSRSKYGRRHPFMLAAIVPAAVAFVLLFSVPKGLAGVPQFLYVLAALFTARIAISVFQVPYFALGGELSDDYAERSTIVSARVIITVLSTVAAIVLTWNVFFARNNGQSGAANYPPLALCFAAIAVVTALLSTLGTLGARGRLHKAPEGARFSLGQFSHEVVEVLSNRSFLSLFLTCLILFAGVGAAAALTLHANTFFWKLTAKQIGFVSLFSPVGIVVGLFAAALMARVIEKRWLAMLGLALIGFAQLGPVALRLAGLITPPQYIPALALATALGGIGACIATIAFQSMMADAADEHEHLFGARREGLYFAGITLSAKASSGVGQMIGLIALDVIGFPHGLAAQPGNLHAISPEIIRNLGITYGPGAALFTTVSVLVLLGYRITKEDHTRMLEEIRQRRADS